MPARWPPAAPLLLALLPLLLAGRPAESQAVRTCALNGTLGPCPLPTWRPTYNLSESSIMYQPWCINGGSQDCTALINVTTYWQSPGRRDEGSVADAHWGLEEPERQWLCRLADGGDESELAASAQRVVGCLRLGAAVRRWPVRRG